MTQAGRRAFVKRDPSAPDGFYAAEAWGLGWLAETGTVRVPKVLALEPHAIAVELVEIGAAGAAGAERLGRDLADLHASGAACFGAPAGGPNPGYIGPLPMDNSPCDDWASFYATRRALPFLRLASDRGAVEGGGRRAIEDALSGLAAFCGDSAREPPRRIHGDLWSGNVLWDTAGQAWLIDPAAQGGHRETDLAMLALFGAPHLERMLAAYDEHRPLADGWRDRVGVHQLHPLLVHAALFGAAYGARAVAVARRVGGRNHRR